MRVLVTGASGFVGSHLVAHLNSIGDEPVGLSRRPIEHFPSEHFSVDLLDTAAVADVLRAVRAEAIVHLAGYADAGRSFREPQEAWRLNLDATLSLYRAVEAAEVRPVILAVTSGMVHGRAAGTGPIVDESTPLLPNSPYGASKAAADLAGYQAFCHPGLPVIRVRPFNQIGPGQSHGYAAAAFAERLARIEAGLSPPVMETGGLNGIRDMTDVRDMVRAYRLLIRHGTPGEAYVAGSGRSVRISDVLDELRRISGVRVEVRIQADKVRPNEVAVARVPATKLREATGWSPEIPLRQSLSDILNDWRDRLRPRRPT